MDALLCAQERAGCPVVVAMNPPLPDWASEYDWVRKSIWRWFVLRDLCNTQKITFPIFTCDWDMLIFRNMVKAYEPFLGYEICRSCDGKGAWAEAYGINSQGLLNEFCYFIQYVIMAMPELLKDNGDMHAWDLFTKQQTLKTADLFEIVNNSVFDHNIHCGEERFVMEGNTKRIHFENGVPYFTRLTDNAPIAANLIHCWGDYKTKTRELVYRAGIL